MPSKEEWIWKLERRHSSPLASYAAIEELTIWGFIDGSIIYWVVVFLSHLIDTKIWC